MSSAATDDTFILLPLDTRHVGSRILAYEEVSSTNDVALRLGGNGTVVVARAQTSGRGRHGRSWHSPADLGLWFSVAFDTPWDGLVFAAALAMRDTIDKYCPAELKWPNDVLVQGRKVCGILVERRKGVSALGIGLNVRHKEMEFPPELRGTAGSLAMFTRRPLNRGVLFRESLCALDHWLELLLGGDEASVRREWARACNLTGRKVRAGEHEGLVTAIDATGALQVETRAGLLRLLSGEVDVIDGE